MAARTIRSGVPGLAGLRDRLALPWAPPCLGAGLLAGLLAGCNSQRFPEPMGGPEELPPGIAGLFVEGPEEALVVRHSDTVHVGRAGQNSIFQLHFYDKQVRVRAGAALLTDAGAKVELVFPRGSRAVLTGRSIAVLGSPSRGEPLLYLGDVSRADLELTQGEYVRLPGGAQLLGEGGPFTVRSVNPEVLALHNRSKGTCQVLYREETLDLNPGEVVHFPRLESGSVPFRPDPTLQALSGAGEDVLLLGDLEVLDVRPERVRLRAQGEGEVRALGLVLRPDPGDEVLLEDLSGSGEEERDGASTDPRPVQPR